MKVDVCDMNWIVKKSIEQYPLVENTLPNLQERALCLIQEIIDIANQHKTHDGELSFVGMSYMEDAKNIEKWLNTLA